jgi:curved DNA-binding protein CbpA
LNLNPFDVLKLQFDFDDSDLKRQYRSLSIAVHPDKNRDNPDAHKVKPTRLHGNARHFPLCWGIKIAHTQASFDSNLQQQQ